LEEIGMTDAQTSYGRNATHPWFKIGWSDVDQFRLTNAGRWLFFEFKHQGHADGIAPWNVEKSYAVLLKLATRVNGSVFLVEYSCEDTLGGVCAGNMMRHGKNVVVSPLNWQAEQVARFKGKVPMTKEEFERFVERIP
jgi:hypothetical protein